MILTLSRICLLLGVLLAVTFCDRRGPKPTEDPEGRLSCALIYPMGKYPKKKELECPANTQSETIGHPKNWKRAKGLKCVSSGYCQGITVPIRKKDSDLKPKRLTYTVDSGQDVVIEFQELGPDINMIKWQTESSEWNVANLTADKKLILTKTQSPDSGIFSFALANGNPSIDTSRLGTVAIIRRKCPMNWFGSDCNYPCEDCMYGGICDADTGECICPPGRKGEFCEEACEGENILNDCTEGNIGVTNLVQFCLPPPYGCSCAPGYKGLLCNQTCEQGSWGVDCLQNCSHCQSNECDSKRGNCINDDLKLCAGGLLGLPRLRRVPRVTPGIREATVEFMEEFDGELPSKRRDTEKRSYYIRLLEKNQLIRNEKMGASSPFTIRGLEPATEYKMAVLVDVWVSPSASCIVDGSLRGERIHTVEFTTDCPEELESPSYVEATDVSQTGFNITITNEMLMRKCNVTYTIYVEKESSEHLVKTLKLDKTLTQRVEGLTSFTKYTYTAYANRRDTGAESKPAEISVRTLPKLPDTPPVNVEEEEDRVKFYWTKPPGTEGNRITYEYAYSISHLGCTNENNTWHRGTTGKEEILLPKPPLYTKIIFGMWMRNEAGLNNITKSAYYNSSQGAPTLQVMSLVQRNESYDYNVFLENNCSKINGEGLTLVSNFSYAEKNVKLDDRYKPPPVLSSFCDIFQCTVYIPGSLYPNTKYNLTVFASNAKGSNSHVNDSNTDSFTTSPVSPHEPQSLSVSTAHDSLTVSWEPPADFPPTGDIEKYMIHWHPQIEKLPVGTKYTTENTIIIQGLETNTTYAIEVLAKNKNVTEFGPPAKETAKTEPHKPLPPCNTTMDTNLTAIAVTWFDCDISNRSEFNIYYKLYFERLLSEFNITYIPDFEGEDKIKETNDTYYEFPNLMPGTGYNLTLQACNQWKCSDSEQLEVYTHPEKPQVDDTDFKVEKPVGSTTKINLPKIKNGKPAEQSVVVMKDNGALTDEQARKKSLDLVKGQECVQENSINKTCPKTDTDDAWIAGKINVDGNGEENSVSIGTGNGTDRALNPTEKYKVTVVTATKSGPYREYVVTKPLNISLSEGISAGLTGALYSIAVFVALALCLVYRYKKQQPQVVVRVPMRASHTFPASVLYVPKFGDDSVLINSRPPVNHRLSISPNAPGGEAQQQPWYVNLTRRISFGSIEGYLSMAINSPDLVAEYESIPTDTGKSCSHGEHPANRPKNRYKNILPYNDTRVKLPLVANQNFTDYINANFVQGHAHPDAYIATQGPKDCDDDTIDDFWRMVWFTNAQIIIMVSNLFENGRSKVAQYWPNRDPIERGGIQITPLSEDIQMDFNIRTFQMMRMDTLRELTHYQYTCWPDHGVPDSPFSLAQMLHMVRRDPPSGPVIVHCSAGIGRTGTVLLTLRMLDQIYQSGFMDAKEALAALREGRAMLIQTKDQYIFAHKLLQEMLCGTKTAYSCNEFKGALDKLREPKGQLGLSDIQEQFNKIKTSPRDLNFNFAKKPEFAHLNRSQNILPADTRNIFLESDGTEESQYVNAIWVRSTDERNAYIVTEHPMPHTIPKIWQMIYENKLSSWTLIHSYPDGGDEEFPSLMPSQKEQLFGNFLVTVGDTYSFENFTEHHVTIQPCKKGMGEQPPHSCVVIQMNGWPHTQPCPDSMMPLLAVMERAESLMMNTRRGLFTCKDGATGCGLLMSLLHVIGKIRLHQVVDVYRSVLDITYDRPEFIVSEEQYDLVHEGAFVYISAYGDYANFN